MKKINIGIIAHVDAGKTTLTENILYLTGVIAKKGRVDSGNTQTDSMEIERRRGISVRATATSFERNGVKYNLLDTPGHVDFIAEVERSLRVLDGVILLISAAEGIQSQTRILMDLIVSQRIPAIIFINKIDRLGADAERVTLESSEYMDGRIVVAERIMRNEDGFRVAVYNETELAESSADILCSRDDELLARYVNDDGMPAGFFIESLRANTRTGELFPVFYGSALYGIGVPELLDAIPVYLPEAECDIEAPVSGVVFKVDNSSGDKQAYIRLYQGRVILRGQLRFGEPNRMSETKVRRLSQIKNGKHSGGAAIEAGDIGVLYLREMRVGDVIGEPYWNQKTVRLGRPTLSAEVLPEGTSNRRMLYEALTELADEDPMLDVTIGDGSEGETLTVRLFGEIQMEILREILLERYGIETSFSEADTVYAETPVSVRTCEMPIGKGHPFRAGVGFRVEPLARGSGFVYESEVWLGNLEKMFQNAVAEAVYENVKRGVYGWEITDAKVVFNYSQYDSVTSTPSDFRNLAPLALFNAFAEAGMALLEPMLEFELRVPGYAVSKVIYECERMRAVIEKTSPQHNLEDGLCITGLIPADACKGYAARTASYTEGKGLFTAKFHGYRETALDESKINGKHINIATNVKLYLMHKLRAMG